jgi:hypothetical protein
MTLHGVQDCADGVSGPTVSNVHPSEPESLAELIADCADIPSSLRTDRPRVPAPRAAEPWQVDATCAAQVNDLDEYV